jgi:hypothetical protein
MKYSRPVARARRRLRKRGSKAVLSSQFSVLSSQFSVLSSQLLDLVLALIRYFLFWSPSNPKIEGKICVRPGVGPILVG